jgi:hypothetical protein
LDDAVESEYSEDLETDGNIAYIHMVNHEKRAFFIRWLLAFICSSWLPYAKAAACLIILF